MNIKTTMEKQVKEVVEGFQPNAFKLITEADIVFSIYYVNIHEVCQNLGQLCEAKKISNPSDGNSLVSVVLGEMATAVVEAIGCSCQESSGAVECKLVSDITHAVVEATVEVMEQ